MAISIYVHQPSHHKEQLALELIEARGSMDGYMPGREKKKKKRKKTTIDSLSSAKSFLYCGDPS
jgi:hypothetical protein